MKFSRIVGTGGYLPEKILRNSDLERMVDTTHEWIVDRTGIEQRHVAAADETTCDLAEQAARRALDAADWDPASLDLIIIATTTPDHVFPSVATQLQDRLGCNGCAAFDIQAVCTGFIYALATADQFIRTGMAKRALVIGAETFTRILDWTDRGTCILFGDGAGAVVLEATDEPGIIGSKLHADGRYKELLWVPAGVSSGYDQTRQNEAYVSMKGSEV
ncbi:MAG: beta-ketoacyl-ACP synthase 3, partial [Candidatus Competibacteraceae bacterium]|nr:beta-ketoacyl-ACP synthase 3 [Candidatus Competibacteraceae bacterium]